MVDKRVGLLVGRVGLVLTVASLGGQRIGESGAPRGQVSVLRAGRQQVPRSESPKPWTGSHRRPLTAKGARCKVGPTSPAFGADRGAEGSTVGLEHGLQAPDVNLNSEDLSSNPFFFFQLRGNS